MSAPKSSIGVMFVLVAVAACASNESARRTDLPQQVWPESPDIARVEFVGEFSDLGGLGIRPSIWGRFVGMVVGKQSDSMVRPMSVVATSDGNTIFVADPEAHCVHRYDIARARYTCLRPKRDLALGSPIGLAVTDDGALFVSDSELGRIYRTSADAKWLELVELDYDIEQPTGIYWDAQAEQLYVCDTKKHIVVVFDGMGRFITRIGRRGSQPGELNFPTSVWGADRDEILVTDSLNFRIQRFQKNGVFVRAFGTAGDLEGDFARPKGVATDSFGHIYVVDALFHAIQIFDQQGTLLLAIGGRGHAPGEFWLPSGIFVSASNMIFVADSYNKRVQMFRYIGPES
jgi:sugar lactone lactonase YvrE